MAYTKLMDGSFLVCGVVPKDAELKKVGEKQSSKTTFSVKASEITKPDGSKQVNWTSCVAWHGNARICEQFKKNDYVLCIGKIEEREYNGKKYKDLVVEFAVKSGGAPAVMSASTAQNVTESAKGGNSAESIDLSEFEEILSDGDCPF